MKWLIKLYGAADAQRVRSSQRSSSAFGQAGQSRMKQNRSEIEARTFSAPAGQARECLVEIDQRELRAPWKCPATPLCAISIG
jgi:hypothetical protein